MAPWGAEAADVRIRLGASLIQEVSTAAPKLPENLKTVGSGLLRNTAVFAGVSFCAYLVSLAKTIVLTRYFGTSPEMDAFTVSVLVPNLLGALVIGSASAGLVPSLGKAEQKGAQHRADVYRSSLLFFSLLSLVITFLLALFAPQIVGVVAHAFDPYRRGLATELGRWSALLVFLNTVSGFASAELLSRRKYALVAGAPAAASVISLALIAAFHRAGAMVLVGSLLVGLIAQALIVFIPSLSGSHKGRSTLWHDSDVVHVIRGQFQLFAVATIGVTNVFIDQVISALLPTGSVSALSYASNLNMVVVQVVVMAMSAVVLTDLSSLAAGRDWSALKHRVRVCAISSLMLAAPACFVILGAGHSAIRMLFQHGVFRADSAALVYIAWAGYSLGLIPMAIGMVASRLANALHENGLLFRIGIVMLVLNAVMDYVLMRTLGLVGITLSTSIVYCVSAVLTYRALERRVGRLIESNMVRQSVKILLAAVISSILPIVIRIFAGNGYPSVAVQLVVFTTGLILCYRRLGLVEVRAPRSWKAWQYVRFSFEDSL